MTDHLHHSPSSGNCSSQNSAQDFTASKIREGAELATCPVQQPDLAMEIQGLQIIDSSDDCIKVLDLNGRILFMNRGGQALLGIQDITPFLNTSWVEFWQESERQAASEAIAKARAGGVCTLQGYCPTLNGELKWWDNKISPIRGTDGQVKQLLCISRDITDRRQTEAALRESEAKYRTLFESIDEGFCLIEVLFDETGIADDYRFLEANPAFERHTGLVDAVGKTIRELVPQLDAHWFEIYGKIALTGVPERFENSAEAMGRFFDVYAFRVGEPHDRKVAILFNDISERKRIEAERKKVEQERDRFLAVGSDLQVITSRNGYFRWVSPAFERILGWTLDEMTARPWTDFVHPDDILESVSETASLFSGTETFVFENRYRHKDGSYRWLLWRAQPHLEEQVLYGAAVDITERVRVEDERKQAEVALRQSEEHYRTLFESIDEGFCTVEVLFDADGKPFDRRILQANPAFERQSGIANPEGKTASELAPGVEQYWNDLYAQVINTGESIRTEVRADALDRWFDILVSRVGDTAMRQVAIVFTDISDRKRMEIALRENEERFRTLADNMSQFAWMADETGWIFWYNQRWFDYTGTTLEEMQGWGWQQVHHPDHVDRVVEHFRQCCKTGEQWEDTFPLQSRDGTYRWFLSRAIPIRDEQGQILRWFGTNTDISDRKQAELEIQKFVSLADNSGEFIGMCDMNFVPFYVNSAGQQLVGLDNVQQYIETSVRDFFFPEDQDFIINEFLPRVLQEGRAEVEIRFRHFKTGAALWMIYNVFYVRGENNQPIGLATVSRNISDRKQAEEALRESENRLRLALESAELGTWDFNPISGVLRWDDSCKAAFGLSPESEINYDVFLSGLHPDDRDRTEQLAQFALNPESNGEFDMEYRTIGLEDGVERWIAAKGKAFFNPAGIASRFIGTVLNITEKKRAEAEREQLLQREQAARETAERANQVKDEFLAVLSHELRSPLNPILGWSKLLQNGKLDAAKTQQALKTIERNAQLQAELIEDLLDVSRILQGKLNLNVSPINLASIIRAAMETVRLAAEAKSIKVEASLEPDVGLVWGDSTRLQQVIWNLLSNAVKFTPQGGEVNIRLERLDSHAYITVSDTGQGIESDFLPYVFDYFRQANATTTRKFGGLGLGLAIARNLVELHGGTVKAESPGVGMGATFTVRLPLMPIIAIANQNGQSSEPSADLNGIQVLVVDDEPDSREFVAFVLEQAGATVLTAATAAEALTMLIQSKPNVLLSDIGMPDMDGYMLMQQVRALPPEQGGQVKAIALTAYAGDFNQQQALQAGFQQHVSKPIEPEKLIQLISSLIKSVS